MRRGRIRSCVLVLLATVLGWGSLACEAGSGASRSTQGTAALPAGLDLSDEALFAGTLDPGLTAQLLDSRFVGIALRAPQHVDIDRRSELPLLVASRFDGARGWNLPFGELAQLVAIDLETGQVIVRSAFGSDKRSAPDSRGARPSPGEMRQFGAQLSRVEARTRLAMPWQPGCWAIRIVYHDWMSNPVHVRLERDRHRAAVACRPASSAGARIEFRLDRGVADGATRLSGRFVLPADMLGADRTALAAALLVVSPTDAAVERVDLRIPIAPVAGARSFSGVIDHEWAFRMTPGALAYLVLAGQVYGPRPWQAAAGALIR